MANTKQHFNVMINYICKQLQQLKAVDGCFPKKNLIITLSAQPVLPLLKAQSAIFPSIYWQDKEQRQSIACFGAIDDTNTIPTAESQARYYGGLAFQQQGEQWQDFPAIRFIRPALEFTATDEQLILTCHFDGQFCIDDTLSLVNKLQPPIPLADIQVQECMRTDLPDKAHWAELVNLAIEYKALLPKVVLSRQTQLILNSPVNHWDLLDQWQLINPTSFHFCFQFSDRFAFIGCSPERLFSRHKSTLQTEALAGTVNRGRNEREDALLLQSLLTDKKIDRENYLVQEFIIANLKQLKATVHCEDARVMQLHNVQHLCVPIHAQLNAQTSDAELLYKLHPTPAVGGTPKLPALQFINDNEPYLRGWYAGAVGYISQEKSDFSVAIRSALVAHNKIQLFAGAGIVTGSIADQEWQELDNKIATILGILTHPHEVMNP